MGKVILKLIVLPIALYKTTLKSYYSISMPSANWTAQLREDTSRGYQLDESSSYIFSAVLYVVVITTIHNIRIDSWSL